MLMPEYPVRAKLRTVTHLARCQVKQNLKVSNLSLPTAVDKLGLLRILKSFIIGDVMNFQTNRGHVYHHRMLSQKRNWQDFLLKDL